MCIAKETVALKNRSLSAMVGEYVIVGFDPGPKWISGKLRLVNPDNVEGWHGALWEKPLLWSVQTGGRVPRIPWYKPLEELFFTTPDVTWWAPVVPKASPQDDKTMDDDREKEA